MKWFWKWVYKKTRDGRAAFHMEEIGATQPRVPDQLHAEMGVAFNVFPAENGRVLKVVIPITNNNASHKNASMHGPYIEKLYIVGPDDNLMDIVARALVEDRLK
jgi:hypothetical protein